MTTGRDKKRTTGVVSAIAVLFIVIIPGTVRAELGTPTNVTFYEDVLPIFQEKCIVCHRSGQVAPMSLRTYEETRPWVKSIRKEVDSGRMPPFFAAGPIGRFKDDLRLRDEEKALILQWIDGNIKRGNPDAAPPRREWDDGKWIDGEPDIVLSLPSFTPRADDRDDYATLFMDFIPDAVPGLYYRGMQLRIENNRSVHHASLFLVNESFPVPENGILKRAITPQEASPIYTWFPGMTEHVTMPEGTASLFPAGKRPALMVHFAPTDDEINQEMELGIYLANGIMNKKRGNLAAVISNFRIPPHAPNYEAKATNAFAMDAYVTHFHTHMHYRGKRASVYFHYPDGRSELVYSLPKFSFDWQRYYRLAEPIFVPKGTRAEFVGVWDNSENNPLNPNPSKLVRWGNRSSDEMFSTSAYYIEAKPLDKPLFLRDGKVVEQQDDSDQGMASL